MFSANPRLRTDHRKGISTALVILASCAREATVRDVPASPPAVSTMTSASASSTPASSTPVVTDTTNQAGDSIVGNADDESLPPMEDSISLGCTPKTFGPRDTLTFRMETPHGHEMAVTTPDKTWYQFVYRPGTPKENYSLAPSETFKTMSTLKVPANIRMPPAVYGRDTPEVVFDRPGQYVVVMGENLHSDYTERPYICRITFSPR
jgi:hypothetical protein